MKVEKLNIGVITENKDELQKYFNLFKFLLKDRITKIKSYKEEPVIWVDNHEIKFITKAQKNVWRGWARHYILNLSQDKEVDEWARYRSRFITYLEEDMNWKELFEKI